MLSELLLDFWLWAKQLQQKMEADGLQQFLLVLIQQFVKVLAHIAKIDETLGVKFAFLTIFRVLLILSLTIVILVGSILTNYSEQLSMFHEFDFFDVFGE